ncbi:MAG: threonine/serine exporter family protein [Bacillota bacterium]|nr:threonine/serine exporter family protein [Bacillota bacterium]
MPESYISCLYAFIACLGFSLVFNLRGWNMLFAAAGGALGWFVYMLAAGLQNDLFQFFLAALALSAYAEGCARIQKAPITVFQIIAILPLVPGGGIYHTMEYAINGNTAAFLATGLHTLAIAGALSIGVLLVSTVVRLSGKIRLHISRITIR